MKAAVNQDKTPGPRRLQRLLLAGVLATALALAACTAGGQDSLLLDSVPADAVMLGSVQPDKVLGDSGVRDSLDQVLGLLGDKTLEGVLAQIQEASGLDPASLEHVLVFAMDGEQGAVLVSGPYSETTVREAAEERLGDLSVTTHRGYDLHTAGEGATLVFLDDDLLLMGKMEAAKAVIDVRAGEAAAIDGELRDSFLDLGDPPAKLFLLTSDGLFDKSGEAKEEKRGDSALADLPIDLGFLTEIASVGATVDAVEQDFAFTLTMAYPDADQASSARQAIEALLGLVTLFSGAPELSELVDGLEIAAEAEVLTVAGQVNPDELESIAEVLKLLDTRE